MNSFLNYQLQDLPNFWGLSFHESEKKINSFFQRDLWRKGRNHFFDLEHPFFKTPSSLSSYSEKSILDAAKQFDFSLPQIEERRESVDGTVKYLLRFSDGEKAESVFIPFFHRNSLCLSTQVGCPVKCPFCATGKLGLKRNLLPNEIVGQFIVVYRDFLKKNLHGHKAELLPNIVFMGQGEPFLNFENIKVAIQILTHPQQIGLGPRQITLSTSGILTGIRRWAQGELGNINLALSLHSPFDEQRKKLIPISQANNLDDIFVILESDKNPFLRKKFITIEYLLLKGVNDSKEHAVALMKRLNNLKEQNRLIINLIGFNKIKDIDFIPPSEKEVEDFKQVLVSSQFRVMIRKAKGQEIMAACGQLCLEKRES